MKTMGPTQARIYVPHGILLLQFQIHGKPKGSWMSYKANTFGHMHLGRIEVEEKETFWS